jgi:hypothetical protein
MTNYEMDEERRREKMAREIATGGKKPHVSIKDFAGSLPQYDPQMRYTDTLGEKDMVKQPEHYTKGDIECIDAMRAAMSKEAFSGYCKGNVLKYVWRFETKGEGTQDLEKAKVYLTWLIENETSDLRGSKAIRPRTEA